MPTSNPSGGQQVDLSQYVTNTQLTAVQESLTALVQSLPSTTTAPVPGEMRMLMTVATSDFVTDANGYLWILPRGFSIGRASSPTAEVADDRLQQLFLVLWSCTQFNISGGRGDSAIADWQDAKALTIPDLRGRSPLMAGSGAALTTREPGERGGAEQHQLSVGELPNHNHRTAMANGPGSNVVAVNTNGQAFYRILNEGVGANNPHNTMHPWFGVTVLLSCGVKA